MSWYPGCKDTWNKAGVIDRLKELHGQGVPHAQIARTINREYKTDFTKNAVTGKVHRLGLYQERGASDPALAARRVRSEGAGRSGKAALENAQKRSAAAQAEPEAEGRQGVGGGFVARPFSSTQPLEGVTDTSAPLPGTIPRRWTERVHGMCNWPVGLQTGLEQLNCCQPVKGGPGRFAASWCEAHHTIGTRPARAGSASTWSEDRRREHGERIRAGLARRRAA